jgi:hypothetical protein
MNEVQGVISLCKRIYYTSQGGEKEFNMMADAVVVNQMVKKTLPVLWISLFYE